MSSSQLVSCIEEERAGFAQLLTQHPDFPKPGILFLDVFPLLRDAGTARALTQAFAQHVRATMPGIEVILGMESRGFVFGVPLAAELGVGFVPVRKAGKLPGAVKSVSFALEYGSAVVEMQTHHGFAHGTRALIVDDLLATGGECRSYGFMSRYTMRPALRPLERDRPWRARGGMSGGRARGGPTKPRHPATLGPARRRHVDCRRPRRHGRRLRHHRGARRRRADGTARSCGGRRPRAHARAQRFVVPGRTVTAPLPVSRPSFPRCEVTQRCQLPEPRAVNVNAGGAGARAARRDRRGDDCERGAAERHCSPRPHDESCRTLAPPAGAAARGPTRHGADALTCRRTSPAAASESSCSPSASSSGNSVSRLRGSSGQRCAQLGA